MKLLPQGCEPRDRRHERHDARLSLRALLMAAAVLLMIPGPAHAADTICTGTLSPAGSPYGNVVVPAGETCSIIDVRVNGNVTVFGSLFVSAITIDTTIGGNINSQDGCGLIEISGGIITAPEPSLDGAAVRRAVVGGNVNIAHCQRGTIGIGPGAPETVDGIGFGPRVLIGKNLKCSNNSGPCTVLQAVVGKNVELSGNGGFVNAEANFIGGNLTANNNDGPVTVFENAIGGDLKCTGNTLAPTGGLNTVAGTKQGQCASL